METTPRRSIGSGFQMLTGQAYKELLRYENAVICLMVLVAVCSIIWSMSLHIISGDFNNGIISAKLAFRERDYTQLSNKSKEIFEHDLAYIVSEYYAEDDDNAITMEPINATTESSESETQTIKPKIRKIPHVFTKTSKTTENPLFEESNVNEYAAMSTMKPKIVVDRNADIKFLSTMVVDVHPTSASYGAKAQFVYTFPFMSEIVAIIWTAMCLIFQTSTKKAWGLPKPWRIVVPSITIFALMFMGNLAYTVMMNNYLKEFCNDLRAPLSNRVALSCGEAMSVLRSYVRQHSTSHDAYMNLFRACYILSLLFWLLALLIMVLRYILAVDFQLVDVDDIFVRKPYEPSTIPQIYTEVLQRSPQHQTQLSHKNERPKSEDDFQSAKSHLSELATPLLEQPHEQQQLRLQNLTIVS